MKKLFYILCILLCIPFLAYGAGQVVGGSSSNKEKIDKESTRPTSTKRAGESKSKTEVSPSFNCGNSTILDADGNSYNTILDVNGRCWINDLLRVGTKLSNLNSTPTNNGIIEKWCYDNDASKCLSDGGIYKYEEAMKWTYTVKAQGICPTGWHIPSEYEINRLLYYGLVGEQICDIINYAYGLGCPIGAERIYNMFPKAGFANTYYKYFTTRGDYLSIATSGSSSNGVLFQFYNSGGFAVINIPSTNMANSIACLKDYTVPDIVTIRFIAGSNGSLVGDAVQNIIPGNSTNGVVGVGDSNYSLYAWSNGNRDTSIVIDNVSDNMTITAIFKKQYTLNYSAGDNGVISDGESSQLVFEGGDGSSITITPNEGYVFKEWSDFITDNPRTDYSVTTNISVTATYTQQYLFTYVADENGYISGTTPQWITDGLCGEFVEAIPNEGYYFVQWNDTVPDNPRQDCPSNTVSTTLTAQFALIE